MNKNVNFLKKHKRQSKSHYSEQIKEKQHNFFVTISLDLIYIPIKFHKGKTK